MEGSLDDAQTGSSFSLKKVVSLFLLAFIVASILSSVLGDGFIDSIMSSVGASTAVFVLYGMHKLMQLSDLKQSYAIGHSMLVIGLGLFFLSFFMGSSAGSILFAVFFIVFGFLALIPVLIIELVSFVRRHIR